MALASPTNGKSTTIEKKKCVTPEFRVSYPHLFKPNAFRGQEPKFSLTMIFPKSTPLKDTMRKAAFAAAEEKWGAKEKWPKKLRMPFRDGDEEREGTDGYQDAIFVSASSKTQPGLVNQSLQPILAEKDFYAGCYARAELIAFAYDTQGNRGVSFSLQNVQKLRDGKAFSGRKDAASVFDAVESAGGDEDDYETTEGEDAFS